MPIHYNTTQTQQKNELEKKERKKQNKWKFKKKKGLIDSDSKCTTKNGAIKDTEKKIGEKTIIKKKKKKLRIIQTLITSKSSYNIHFWCLILSV